MKAFDSKEIRDMSALPVEMAHDDGFISGSVACTEGFHWFD